MPTSYTRCLRYTYLAGSSGFDTLYAEVFINPFHLASYAELCCISTRALSHFSLVADHDFAFIELLELNQHSLLEMQMIYH